MPAGERLPIMAQVKRALRFVRGHRTVATLIGVGFGNSFAFGAVLGLLVPYGVTELGLSRRTPASGSSTGPRASARSWPAWCSRGCSAPIGSAG